MAGHAANPLLHMDAVLKVGEIGEIMDPRPGKRSAGAEAFPDRCQHGAVGPDLRVADHADLRCWNACETGYLYGGVTVATGNAKAADVVLVAASDGLLAHDIDLRHVC